MSCRRGPAGELLGLAAHGAGGERAVPGAGGAVADAGPRPRSGLAGGPTAATCRRLAVVGLLAAALLPRPARATPPPTFSEVFHPAEPWALGGAVLLTGGLFAVELVHGARLDPGLGVPAEGSLDRRLAATFAGGEDSPLLGGVPFVGGLVFAASPLLLYGSDRLWHAGTGAGWLDPVQGSGLRLMASAEALTATLLVTQALKLGIGRTRPRHALYGQPIDEEAHLSFPSGHASLAFSAASFLTLDLGARVSGPAQVGAGVLLHALAGLVAFSRVHDQAHYLSDVVVGAALGIASGAGCYLAHFHLDGRARRRGASLPVAGTGLSIAPLLGVVGRF